MASEFFTDDYPIRRDGTERGSTTTRQGMRLRPENNVTERGGMAKTEFQDRCPNRLTVHILAAVAEHERGAISERTKAALAAARRRGVKLGGPRLAAARKASIKARSEAADAFAANVRQASGVSSMRGIARALAARGVKTARGGDWSDVQVAAILRR